METSSPNSYWDSTTPCKATALIDAERISCVDLKPALIQPGQSRSHLTKEQTFNQIVPKNNLPTRGVSGSL